MSNLRILVTGSRDWRVDENNDVLRDALVGVISEHRQPGTPCTLVVGDCPTGADFYASELVRYWRDIHPDWFTEPEVHHANWREHGKAAGPIRNQAMVDSGADICVAFPHGSSRGTWDCVKRAQGAGITTVVIPGDTS